MAKRMTDEQRRAVLEMLAQGLDRETIAARVGVTPGQVSATAAHVTMGTYDLNSCRSASTAPAVAEELAPDPNTLATGPDGSET